MTLRARAIIAYEQALEAQRQEDIDRQSQARRAHEQNLRTLCSHVLDTDCTLHVVEWLPDSGLCWPFVQVDGLVFTCPPDRERLELAACVSASNVYQNGTHIENMKHLGQILSDPYYKPCRIEGGRIVVAEEANANDAI